MPFYEMLPGGMPAGLQSDMDAVLNKKWGTSTTYPPEDWPGTVNLMGPLPEKTVSGSVVAFSDGADAVKLKSCEVTIAPTLDGVSSVDVVSAGKNVFDITTYPITKKRYIRASDGYFAISTIDLRGATEDYIPCVSMRGKTWVINKTNQSGNTMGLAFYDENKAFLSSVLTWPSGTNGVFTVPNNAYYFRFTVDLSSADDTEIQIEAGTTATAYAPYVAPTTHTANLGRTIYGGEVDVVNGTGTDNCKKIALGDFTWIKSGTEGNFYCQQITDLWYPSEGGISRYGIGVSDEFEFVQGTPTDGQINAYFNTAYSGYRVFIKKADYADRTSAEFKEYLQSINAHLVYKVNDATADDFTFTPVPIISRLGDNTMWGDGDLSVTYRCDIDLALAQ